MRKVAKTITEMVTSILRNDALPQTVNQGHLNTTIVAIAVAYRLPLPTGPVNRPDEWFLIHCHAGAEDVVGQLNEYLVLDVEETLKVLKEAWRLRYRILHNPFAPQALHALLCTFNESNFDVAPVYRDWICTLGNGSAQQVMMAVSNCMNECGVLPVEFDDV